MQATPASNKPVVTASAVPPPVSDRWRKWWFALVLLAFGGALLAEQLLVFFRSADELRALVPVSTVWGMHACVILGLAALAGLAERLVAALGRRHLMAGLALAVVGFGACGLAPRTNRIFYDEHIYMQIGQTLAHTGRAEYGNHANAEHGEFEVFDAWVNKQPNGHPYLLSWCYRLFGVSETVSHLWVRTLVGLTAALLYLGLVLVPERLPRGTPVAAALAFIFTPLVLWWGHTVAVEPAAVATTVAAIFAACVHARLRDPQTGEGTLGGATLLAATVAFAAYFRPESLLAFPVAALLLLALERRSCRDRPTWAALALAIALVMPNLLHLWAVRGEDWGATDGDRFGGGYLWQNLASNAGYFVQGKWFPVAGTVLALFGAGWLAVRQRLLGMAVGAWLLLSWGIFVLFYAGGYHYGASSRYGVISTAPVALLVGLGAAQVWALVGGRRFAAGLLGGALLLNWVRAMHYVPTLGREACEARADVAWIREAANTLPDGALVISPNPCLWNILGRNASQPGSIADRVRHDLPELQRQYPGGIFVHWDYWANVQADIGETLRQFVVPTKATIWRQGESETYKFALFQVPLSAAATDEQASVRSPKGIVDRDAVAAEALQASPVAPAAAVSIP